MKEKRGIIFKIALLSSSLLLTGLNAVSAILPYLQGEYDGVSRAAVQQFITMPGFAQVAACLLGGMLAARVGKKRMLLWGCICFIIGGFGPMFVQGLGMKIGLRLIMGAGIGFIQPLSASMIADFFEGGERDTLMGLQSAVVGLGSIVMTFVVSCIITRDWTRSYLVYGIGIIVFLVTLIFIPDTGRQQKRAEDAVSHGRNIPGGAIPMCAAQFIYTTASFCIFISLSYAVVENGVGSASQASLMLTVYSITSLLGGIVFGRVYGKLHKKIGPAALLLSGAALLCIGMTRSLPLYFLCMAAAGVGFAWFMPFTIANATEHATLDNSAVATSLVFAGNGLGGAFAAYIITGIGNALGNTESIFTFVFCGLIQICLGAAIAVWDRTRETKTGERKGIANEI